MTRFPRISGSGQVAMEPRLTYSQKVERERETEERTPRPISHPCDVICRAGRVYTCWILYGYEVRSSVRRTEYVILYTYTVDSKYSRPVTECRTPPSPSVSFWHHQPRWNPPPPLGWGGSCGDLCPTLPGIRLVKGPIICNQNHLGQFGFVAGNPCSGPFLYMVTTEYSL